MYQSMFFSYSYLYIRLVLLDSFQLLSYNLNGYTAQNLTGLLKQGEKNLRMIHHHNKNLA